MPRDGREELRGDEALLEDERAPRGDEGVHDEVLTEAVEEGQGAEAPVGRRHAEVMDRGVGVRHHVGLGQHDALGTPGGGRGVEDGGHVLPVGIHGGQRRTDEELLERDGPRVGRPHPEADARRGLGGWKAGRGRSARQDRDRLAVPDDVTKLLPDVGDVQRHRRHPELLTSVVGEDEVRPVAEVETDPFAGADAPARQTGRNSPGLPVQLAVAPRPLPEDEGGSLGCFPRRRLQEVGHVHRGLPGGQEVGRDGRLDGGSLTARGS